MQIQLSRSKACLISCVALAIWACGPAETEPESQRGLVTTDFGMLDDQLVKLFTLTNASGAQVSIAEYGGIVVSLKVPDREGNLGDVVLGFDNLDSYVQDTPYFGAITGRYANRIAAGKLQINGRLTSFRSTTARTRCTAASRVSTR